MNTVLGGQPFSFWFIFITYGIVIVSIGIYFSKYVKSTEDFFSASRQTPWWASGISFFMTAFSASVFIGSASFTYKFGLLSLIWLLCNIPIFLFGYMLFSYKWHRTGAKTAIEFIENRFGASAANFFVWTGIPIRILDNANRTYVTAVFIQVIFGLDLWIGILITSVVSVLSAIGGGFLGVVLVDAIQGIALFVIVAIVAFAGFIKVGGLNGLITNLPAQFWDLKAAGTDYTAFFVLSMVFVQIFSWNGYWSLVQRYVSVPSESDAKKVALTTGVSYYLLFPLLTLPPIFAAVLIPGLTGTNTEHCYLLLSKMLLPAALLGLLAFGILAATTTSLNSELNVISQILIQDVLKKIFVKTKDKIWLLISRITIVTIMAACAVVAIAIRKMGGSFAYLMALMSITTLPTFVPLLFGLLYRKTPGWGAIASFCMGTATAMTTNFILNMPLAATIVLNFIATSSTMLITGIFWPVAGQRREVINQLFDKLTHKPIEHKHSNKEMSVNTKLLLYAAASMFIFSVLILLTLPFTLKQDIIKSVGTVLAFTVIGFIVLLLKKKWRC